MTRAKKRPKTYLAVNQQLKKTLENREKSGERPFAAKEWQEKGRKMSVYPTKDAIFKKRNSSALCHILLTITNPQSLFAKVPLNADSLLFYQEFEN